VSPPERAERSVAPGPDQSHGVAFLHLDAVAFIDLWDLLIRPATPWNGVVEWNVGFVAVLIPGQLTVDTRHDMGVKGGLRSVHENPWP